MRQICVIIITQFAISGIFTPVGNIKIVNYCINIANLKNTGSGYEAAPTVFNAKPRLSPS